MCSRLWHFHPALVSECLLGRSSPNLSCCVQHEVWSKAQETPLNSTCWYLRRNRQEDSLCETIFVYNLRLKRINTHQCWRYARLAGPRLHCSPHWLKSCCLKLEVLHETWGGFYLNHYSSTASLKTNHLLVSYFISCYSQKKKSEMMLGYV